jgi:glycosyltransferase involved in cell wall biosynthesis
MVSMRIVLDLQACQASSMHRGIGRYSLSLALAIARHSAGHDLRIVVNSAFPDSAAALRTTFGALVPAAAISAFATPLPTAEGDPRNRWRLLAAERMREHYLASLRPDVVHVSSLFEGLGDDSVNSLLHGNGRFETAITLYDLIPLLRKERYLDDPNQAAWYYRKLESLKRAELLVAISGHAREEAIAALGLAPAQVVNISSAADAIFRPLALAPEARAGLLVRYGLRGPFIMYTGGIDYRKNIEGLIEAYAALPGAMRRQYQLAVVCSIRDPDRVRLQRLAARLGLADTDLVLTGYVSDDDLVALYNCTALFVFPSLHEGFGLPVLEAMSCGAPVIGANTSSIPEVIDRADAMFDPTSVPAMTAAMAHVLGEPAFARTLREHGLAQARLFSWDATAQRAMQAFQEAHQRNEAARATSVAAGPGPGPVPRLRLAWIAPEPAVHVPAELAHFYDIDPIPAARQGDWLDAHAHQFDRIVYEFGNTPAHASLFPLLERHPGLVVLHDFFLGAALDHADCTGVLPDAVRRALYLGHGYQALLADMQEGRQAACQAYPCNRAVLERALGIMVPTPAAMAMAAHWNGPEAARDWRVVPAGDAGARMHDAIETLMRDGQGAARQHLVRAIAGIDATAAHGDHLQAAAAIAANRLRPGARQILLDVTRLVQDAAADAARRTGAPGGDMVRTLLIGAPAGWRVEPVRHDGKRYRYARAFTLDLLGCVNVALDDAVADAGTGDILLGTDPVSPALFPQAWQACGVTYLQGDARDGETLRAVLAQLHEGAARQSA